MKKILKADLSRFFFTTILLLFCGLSLNASHMVGGEMSYVHLGGDEYEITMSLYRDCGSAFAAPMPTELSIFVRNSLGIGFDESGSVTNIGFIVPLLISEIVFSESLGSAPDFCWADAPDICLEKGVFRTNITLPAEFDTYEISSQLCCRNATIINIVAPDGTGATFSTNIPPASTGINNNSAVFNEGPPIAVCTVGDFSFDQSASDVDGDSLVYEFYSPFSDGLFPNYGSVVWQTGFDELNQLGSGMLDLNEETGTFLVNEGAQVGTYLIGIQVSEYRDGEPINVNRREFQLIVVEGEGSGIGSGGGSETITQLQLMAFYDENENGVMDEEESLINQSFEVSGNSVVFSSTLGTTNVYLIDSTTYTITLIEDNPLWIFSGEESSVSFEFDGLSDVVDPIFFPMTPVGDFIIQDIDLTSSIIRCNQVTNYWLTYTNNGTTVNNGYIELIPDSNTEFISAWPSADSTAGDTLYWFYENLLPTYSEQIYLNYQMPSADFIGEQIAFEANIETWEGFGDDKTTISSELVCSFDPNDKLHSPSGYGETNYTLFGDTLEYTIRFQNTGNDTAFVVIIEDVLSEHLDLSTFRPIASSHQVEASIDMENRLATFVFNDIYLPDSTTNLLASQGFVKYQILGNGELQENTSIENMASIFFDLNDPILTNTVSNQMVSELPLLPVLAAESESVDFGNFDFNELPSDIVQMVTIENLGDLPLEIEAFNISGASFSTDAETLVIEGQGSIEVPIYFSGTDIGAYQGELLIESNVGALTIAITASVMDGLGIITLGNELVDVYPNPNNGAFVVKAQNGEIQSISVQNSLGEIVFVQDKIGESITLDFRTNGVGIYFVTVQTKAGIQVKKIVVH